MKQSTRDNLRYLLFKILGAPAFSRWIEWRKIIKWLNPQKGEIILDIACGAGDLSLKIAEKSCEVHGIDMLETGIESARRLSNRAKIKCEFTIGDAERLPYPDGYFDAVICSSSLEHFKNDAQALGEMGRVLKPDGRIVLTVDSLTCPISAELKERHRKMYGVEHYYTREDLAKALKDTGLDTVRSEYLLTSALTGFFFKLTVKYNLPGVLLILITFFSPLCLLSDKLFGKKDGGYTLIAQARRND